MKRIVVIAMALLGTAMAQNPQAPPPTAAQSGSVATTAVQIADSPSYKELYCAGFITKEAIPHNNLIMGGEGSPDRTLFVRGNMVFVNGGGMEVGQEYTVLRELLDPNHYEPFRGAHSELAALGQPYAELGHVRVVALRENVAVAQVVYSCQNMSNGDIVVPFKEHQPVTFRKTEFERFPPDKGHLTARIVMGREFDADLGRGQIAYINAGTDKGVKLGDYFRVVRGYGYGNMTEVDALSSKAPTGEDTQKNPGIINDQNGSKLPLRALGEVIIINVTPTSATALITRALEDIEVGDMVQLEGE